MHRSEIIRRYALFLISVMINSLGIAIITTALLGTSPISSLPYVLSLITPATIGQWTIYSNLAFILMEMTMMKRAEIKEKRYELLAQVPITLFFGVFIDIFMSMFTWIDTSHYAVQLLTLLIGCFVLGSGISLEVKANVAMVVGEYFVSVISRFCGKQFAFVKVCFDCTLVAISCVLSVASLGSLEGVREGTVIAALAVGPISKFVTPAWHFLDAWISDGAKALRLRRLRLIYHHMKVHRRG